jgi:deoxyadenosine/deoxycytidine kinase
MRRIIFTGVHAVGKTTYAKDLLKVLKEKEYNARLYSLDNYKIYRSCQASSSQFDRLYFGAQRIKEAEEESPEIGIFDRSLTDNIFYSKCFNRFVDEKGNKFISDEELTNIIRFYQSLEQRKFKSDALIIFLNPDLETMIKGIKGRKREIGTILEREDFITCLKKMFESYYHQYFESPFIELHIYDEKTILEVLYKNDILQENYE